MADQGINGTWWVDDIAAYRAALAEALAEGQLSLDYQPRFSLEGGWLCGAEGLARWDHPVHGRLTAAEFVGAAEVDRVVGDLDAFVIAAACAQLKEWDDAALLLPGFYFSVNISAQDLDNPGFATMARSALERTGVDPARLRMEVTCTSLSRDPATTIKVLGELQQLGVGVDLDVFGEGYTSLATLRAYRPGRVGTSLRHSRARPSPDNDAVLGLSVQLFHSMGAGAVAKAIDTQEVLDWLKGLGYDEGQGFFLGRPASPADLVPLLKEARNRQGVT